MQEAVVANNPLHGVVGDPTHPEPKQEAPKPIEVEAEERIQAGYKIYVANCPKCGMTLALNDYGHAFHKCGAYLKYIPKKATPAA